MEQPEHHDICVIGGGPAGIAAADAASAAGASVLLADQMPTLGRKFLMAGKSGLNLTKDIPHDLFTEAITGSRTLAKPLASWSPARVVTWAEALGQPVFTGSSGRVFPRSMKASPLLRAWLERVRQNGVDIRTRWRWTGWEGDLPCFETPTGPQKVRCRATVLALGGGSWARLGSDGRWVDMLRSVAKIADFQPSNVGLDLAWSSHMARHFGAPIKGVALTPDRHSKPVRGDFVITSKGVEGGATYPLSPKLRTGGVLIVDLLPDRSEEDAAARLSATGSKLSLSNRLRRALKIDGAKAALLRETIDGPLPRHGGDLARRVKRVRLQVIGARPLDEAISTAGGLRLSELTDCLMLRNRPGVFCAGEMLDWDAPTGGYLITTCLATGDLAGRAAAEFCKSHAAGN